jgi:hypothetical protein
MRTICAGCKILLRGDADDQVTSHGACTPECNEFHGALRDYGAQLLEPDPLVARFAVRVLSDEEPKFYEVALLVDYHETHDNYGDPVSAPSGKLYWNCDCRDACERDSRPCKHVNRAVELRALHGRMLAAKSRRAAS